MQHHLALVTGATSGIGQALCFLLAQKGISLTIAGRNQQQLNYLVGSLSSDVVRHAAVADLATDEGRQQIVALLHRYCPDLVINNAGFGLYGEALSYTTDEQKAILTVNATAVLELTLEAARTLISNEKAGVILNVSSAAAFQISPYMAVYAASKAFVNQVSQALDEECKPYGVRVLTACPGMVDTSFSKRAGGKSKTAKGVMTADFVAESMWKQVNELNPLMIIDWKYRLLTGLSYLFPKKWIASMMKKSIAERIGQRNLIKTPPCNKKTN